MIANVVHTSLNYRGGAEALAMTTIDALVDLGFDIELAVVERPQREKLESSFGSIAASILKNISAINTLKSFVTSSFSKILLIQEQHLRHKILRAILPIESLLSMWGDRGYQHLSHNMICKNSKKELE